MNAEELFLSDGKSAGVWYCSKCRIVKKTKAEADECCRPRRCDCGNECEKYYTECKDCIREKEIARERAKFDAAKHVNSYEYDGWVYCDSLAPEYFDSVGTLLEYVEDNADDGCEIPAYVWACKPHRFAIARIEYVLDSINNDGYDDFSTDDLDGVDELAKAMEEFNKKNESIVCYDPDYSIAVIIEKQT